MLCHPICNWLYVDKVGHSHAVIHTDERGDYIRMRWLWCWCSVDASHVAHMNESRGTYECVMSHIWMSHGAHMKEVTVVLIQCECVWMTESWRTYEWVMAHMWMRHVTNACGWLRESIEYAWLRHGSFICDMTHSSTQSHSDAYSIQSCILNPHSHAYSIRIDTIE